MQKDISIFIVFDQPADSSKCELLFASTVNIQDVLNAGAVFQSPANGNVSFNNGNETLQSSEIRRVASLIKRDKEMYRYSHQTTKCSRRQHRHRQTTHPGLYVFTNQAARDVR